MRLCVGTRGLLVGVFVIAFAGFGQALPASSPASASARATAAPAFWGGAKHRVVGAERPPGLQLFSGEEQYSYPDHVASAVTAHRASAAAAEVTEKVYFNRPSNSPERPRGFVGAFGGKSESGGRRALSVNSNVMNLVWGPWGGPTAQASGRVHVYWVDNRTNPKYDGGEGDVDVTLTMTGRERCGGRLIYTAYSLVVVPGAQEPRYFDHVRHGSYPCSVHGGGHVNNQKGNPKYGSADCDYQGLTEAAPSFTSSCMSWKSYGSRTTIGTGFIRRAGPFGATGLVRGEDSRAYAIRVTLTRLTWCPRLTVAYTRARTVVYGDGLPDRKRGPLPRSTARKLRTLIGRPGVKRRTFADSIPARQRCEPPLG